MSEKFKSTKRRKRVAIGGGVFSAVCITLIIVLPVWFLVIDADDEEDVSIKLEECNADGLGLVVHFVFFLASNLFQTNFWQSYQDYYKFVDCMPEKREQDNEYKQQSCQERGCIWNENSNPKGRS